MQLVETVEVAFNSINTLLPQEAKLMEVGSEDGTSP